jgi:hypothetical protein
MKLKGEIEIILCFFILVGFLSAIVPSSLSSANEISSFSSTLDSFNGESSYVRAINILIMFLLARLFLQL